MTGSNDAPVAKDATETTEENTVPNGNVPAATDVDVRVAAVSATSRLFIPRALTFNDAATRSLQAATSMTSGLGGSRGRDAPSHTPRPTTTQA
ncbi:hypothetical protein O9992_19730 [Vibrio lentus]|nr:hypothetical protein [Vibrio lentus]